MGCGGVAPKEAVQQGTPTCGAPPAVAGARQGLGRAVSPRQQGRCGIRPGSTSPCRWAWEEWVWV
jgi:hypothetical protein